MFEYKLCILVPLPVENRLTRKRIILKNLGEEVGDYIPPECSFYEHAFWVFDNGKNIPHILQFNDSRRSIGDSKRSILFYKMKKHPLSCL